MAEVTMEARKELAVRLAKLNYMFTVDYLKDLADIEAENKKVEDLKNTPADELHCVVMTGEWNAKVALDCMKECCEVIAYLTNAEECVCNWQMAGITAMLDTANAEHSYDYSMPQAISDILGIRFMKE